MIFNFYLADNNEIVIFGYENLSAHILELLDAFVSECNCKRDDNFITGDPANLMDLLVVVSTHWDILL